MGKIIHLFDRKGGQPVEHLTKDEALQRLSQLVWDNPRAYFVLELKVNSKAPVRMDDSIRAILLKLDLIDSHDCPTIATKIAIKDIGKYMNEQILNPATY